MYENTYVVIVDSYSQPVFKSIHLPKRIVAHSTAKLIQSLPVYLLGLDKEFGLNAAELAILSSSILYSRSISKPSDRS